MLNAQFSILIRKDLRKLRQRHGGEITLSDQLEERWMDFATRIIDLVGRLPRTFEARHIANPILRSGTAGAPNSALPPESIAGTLAENTELARIVLASIKTARSRVAGSRSGENWELSIGQISRISFDPGHQTSVALGRP